MLNREQRDTISEVIGALWLLSDLEIPAKGQIITMVEELEAIRAEDNEDKENVL